MGLPLLSVCLCSLPSGILVFAVFSDKLVLNFLHKTVAWNPRCSLSREPTQLTHSSSLGKLEVSRLGLWKGQHLSCKFAIKFPPAVCNCACHLLGAQNKYLSSNQLV